MKNPALGLKSIPIPFKTYDHIYTGSGTVESIIREATVAVFSVDLPSTTQYPLDPLTKCTDISILYHVGNHELHSFILN